MRTLIILCLLLFSSTKSIQAQSITQNIKGRVIDQQSQTPLPGVNIYLDQDGVKKGTVTDLDGYYKIEKVKVGRVSIHYAYIGYEPIILNNQELLGSKELIINIELRESTEKLDEVVVKATDEPDRTKNERVNVSGRSFSIEETQRFAGANQDVSRMASNFAGVQRTDDSNNDIVIRGNSPFGLIWRLEGMDIPNPNHFGGLGATGGPVSMLNNNVLTNSDFITGAFPSDYGDGISGVFDLQLRNGNSEEYEFLGQIGFNGLEFGAEGPFSKNSRSSFLINYRYSTLGVMSAMGIDFGTGTAIPEYQDLNFKVNIPSKKFGVIEVFGLGGNSAIDFLDSENDDSEDGGFYSDNQDLRNKVRSGVIGASHQYFFGKDMYSKVSLAASGISNITSVDTFNTDGSQVSSYYGQHFVESRVQLNAVVNKKFNVHHVLRAGGFVTFINNDLKDSVYDFGFDGFRELRNFVGNDVLYQPYINWQYRINDEWEMNTGLHSMIQNSNGNYSLEPRFGMSYRLRPNQSVNFGYGLHSQNAPAVLLHQEIRLADGSYFAPNKDIDFVKSHHFVLGYNLLFGNGWQFKPEAYYQNIYDATASASPSSFSGLNAGSFSIEIPDTATNNGIGYNYGLDITLEKFMDKGFYLLSTLSLFESKYQGSDEVWRNTAFNGNYVFNALGGKEFVLKYSEGEKAKRQTLTVDAKLTTAGGQRYTPLNLSASQAAGEAVYNDQLAYEEQFDPYFRADIRLGYKVTGNKVTQEWALDIQNITNHKNAFGQSFDAETGQAETTYQLGLFPMVLYRITF